VARWRPRAAHAVECAQVTLPGGGDALRWWASDDDDDDDDQGDGDDGEAGAGERRAASGSRAVAEDADAAGGIPIPTARRHSRSIDVGQPGNTPVKVWELQLTPNSERARCATPLPNGVASAGITPHVTPVFVMSLRGAKTILKNDGRRRTWLPNWDSSSSSSSNDDEEDGGPPDDTERPARQPTWRGEGAVVKIMDGDGGDPAFRNPTAAAMPVAAQRP
jgi:hypothetical protein